MTTELIVAEKPRVAEKIASAIAKNVKAKKYQKVSYYEGERDGIRIIVAPAVGHVYTLTESGKRSEYPVFDIKWVPSYTVGTEAAFTKPYVDLLESLAKKADRFVGACDYDIEGSLIGYNVFRFTSEGKEASRMKFSALTSGDLLDAYENRGELDYNNAFAGEARHILDWYYGINLSRALMGAVRAANRYKVMSIGRVQGPALNILSELEGRIKSFVPSPYWELTTQIKGVEFMHGNGRFTDEAAAKASLDRTGDSGKVSGIEKKEQIISPPSPFDLTSLQVEAYRAFKLSPARTLEIAQKLYEETLISYPRTSSQKLPAKLNLGSIIKKLAENSAYTETASKLIAAKRFTPAEGKKDDPAHPAIHPTGTHGRLDVTNQKLYDLIVRRFLATFAENAKKMRTRILVDSNGEVYSASGVRTVESGWISSYAPYYDADDKELPEFSNGETVALEKKKNTQKVTKPLKRDTEASISCELGSKHVGTEATRWVIIETLFKRGYVESKSISVTDFGMQVCSVLRKYAPEILDENLTRSLEDKMELIQEGKADKDEVIKEGREILVQTLDRWKKNEAKIGSEIIGALRTTEEKKSMVGGCKLCGNQLRIIKMKLGRQFIGCSGYPNCRNAYPLPTGAWVATIENICEACQSPMVLVKFKGGKRAFPMCIDPKCPTKDKWRKSNEAPATK